MGSWPERGAAGLGVLRPDLRPLPLGPEGAGAPLRSLPGWGRGRGSGRPAWAPGAARGGRRGAGAAAEVVEPAAHSPAGGFRRGCWTPRAGGSWREEGQRRAPAQCLACPPEARWGLRPSPHRVSARMAVSVTAFAWGGLVFASGRAPASPQKSPRTALTWEGRKGCAVGLLKCREHCINLIKVFNFKYR